MLTLLIGTRNNVRHQGFGQVFINFNYLPRNFYQSLQILMPEPKTDRLTSNKTKRGILAPASAST